LGELWAARHSHAKGGNLASTDLMTGKLKIQLLDSLHKRWHLLGM
jgi:hypothetical protein